MDKNFHHLACEKKMAVEKREEDRKMERKREVVVEKNSLHWVREKKMAAKKMKEKRQIERKNADKKRGRKREKEEVEKERDGR